MKIAVIVAASATFPVSLLGQAAATQPVHADPVSGSGLTAPQQEVTALQQQVADLQKQVQQLKGQQAGAPVQSQPMSAVPAPPPTPAAETPAAPLAPPPTHVQPVLVPAPAPVPIVTAPPVIASPLVEPVATRLPAGTWVRVTRVSVTDTKVGGNPGLHVVAYVTIHGLPNVQFTFQAALVTPDGKIHTDIRGNPYVATRGVQTGDYDDTDDYGVDMSLRDLFTSGAPGDLGVQVRILDVAGGVVAESEIHGFRRP